MANDERVVLLDFAYVRSPATSRDDACIDIEDERGEPVEHDLPNDSSQKDILRFVQAYKAGRRAAIEVMQAIVIKAAEDTAKECENQFYPQYLRDQNEWEIKQRRRAERKAKAWVEVEAMFSAEGFNADPRMIRLHELLTIIQRNSSSFDP